MLDVSRIKAVGFDVDGTLYQIKDPMEIAIGKAAVHMAADKLGRSFDDFEEKFLERRETFISNTKTLNSFGLDGEEIFRTVIDSFDFEKFVPKDTKLISVIHALKKKYRLFIITNGSHIHVDRKLEHMGLNLADFDPRIYCYDRGWLKPDPAPFLAALDALKVKPEEAVYVGDHPDLDIKGAKAVGMKTIYIQGENMEADGWTESVYDIEQLL